MIYLTRRRLTVSVASAAMLPAVGFPAVGYAQFDLGGIGASLLQGLGGFSSQPVQSLVQTGMSLAANAVQLAAPTLAMAAPLLNVAAPLLQTGAQSVQAAPIFVNPGVQDQNISFYSRAPSRPLQLGDSDEQHLRGDPYDYVARNSGFLGDFISRGGGDIIPLSYRAHAASRNEAGDLVPYWGMGQTAYQGQGQRGGFYPSVTSGSADISSVLKDVAALAPLISLFLM